MKYTYPFIITILFYSVCLSQTTSPNDHRSKYTNKTDFGSKNSSTNIPIIISGINATEKEIKVLRFQVDSLNKAKTKSEQAKEQKINYLNGLIDAKVELLSAQKNELQKTKEYVVFLEADSQKKDSIISYQNELIVEFSKPNDIPHGKRFTFKNKPYSFNEHILWIALNDKNQIIINEQQKNDIKFLLDYVSEKKGLKLLLVGPKYENSDYNYKSLTGGTKSMNYSTYHYCEIVKDYIFKNYTNLVNISDKILTDTEKGILEKRVSIRIDN